MTENASDRSRLDSIRRLAEEKLSGASSIDLEKMTPDEVRRVVHELEVHQVELEIQNEQLEEAQREAEVSRERYRHLYESAPIGYMTIDAEGAIRSVNASAAELLHRTRAQVLGRKLSTFVAAEHQDRWHFARRALMEGGERRSLELSLVLDDRSLIEVGLTASAVRDGDDSVSLGLLDLTELRRSERELRKAASAASMAEQHERRKLAAELHDDAGQLISLASIKLRSLASAIPPERQRELSELSDLLTQIRQQITSLSFQMSPPLLHDVGLMAAVRWLAEDLARTYGLSVTVVDAPEIPLDEVSRVILFQAIRELLINVKKHARVDKARVQIGRDGAMVQIVVEDGGVGFVSDAHRESLGRPDGRGGFGLLALRERLGQLGGTILVG